MCFGFVEQAQGGVAVAVGSQGYEGLQPLQTQPQVGSSAERTQTDKQKDYIHVQQGRAEACVVNSVWEMSCSGRSSQFVSFAVYSAQSHPVVFSIFSCTYNRLFQAIHITLHPPQARATIYNCS